MTRRATATTRSPGVADIEVSAPAKFVRGQRNALGGGVGGGGAKSTSTNTKKGRDGDV